MATVTISDNYTNGTPFGTVTNLPIPIGIDYSPTLQSLLVSIADSTATNNFVRLYTNSSGQLIVTNWSGVHGVLDEVKLATVNANAGGFTNGDMFFGSDTNIGWLSADGTSSDLTWCTLTNGFVTNALLVRGSLYVDQTGLWSNHLVAVTSDTDYNLDDKGVWEVAWGTNGKGLPRFITNITTFHLEGIVTLPNTNTWGPWAGKIITGDEAASEDFVRRPLIYAIDTNGVAASFPLGISPEDFDIIPTNQDLYCTISGSVVKLPSTFLAGYVDHLLITQSGEFFGPPTLFIVNWDASITNFVVRSIPAPFSGPGVGFEHVTFAPIHLPTIP